MPTWHYAKVDTFFSFCTNQPVSSGWTSMIATDVATHHTTLPAVFPLGDSGHTANCLNPFERCCFAFLCRTFFFFYHLRGSLRPPTLLLLSSVFIYTSRKHRPFRSMSFVVPGNVLVFCRHIFVILIASAPQPFYCCQRCYMYLPKSSDVSFDGFCGS